MNSTTTHLSMGIILSVFAFGYQTKFFNLSYQKK